MALFIFKKDSKNKCKNNKSKKKSPKVEEKENYSKRKKSIIPKIAVPTGPKEKDIQANLIGSILTSNSKKAYTYSKSNQFGEHVEDKIKYTLTEGLFLVQNEKMEIKQGNKILTPEELVQKFTRIDKKFPIKYAVFKDLRIKGYVVKTALKFGAEFRVYEKGKKPSSDHSKWIVFTDSETNKTTWHDFAAKNRVAHSTNKNVLLSIVDEEERITYYEIKWIKP
jgi:tRNA-intron endonuclease, archaea type